MTDKSVKDFIQLIKSIINGTGYKPSEDINWSEVYKLAQEHNVNNLILKSSEKLSSQFQPPADILSEMKEAEMNLAIMEEHQTYYVDELLDIFEKNGFELVMLKGWLIRHIYPADNLRSMADTDIFMRPEYEKRVHKIFLDKGYTVISYGGVKDNVYFMPPFNTVEMHKNLFRYQSDWNEFFKCIWNRVVPLEGYKSLYKMDNELTFVYMIAHIAKHMQTDGGIGIRAFIDLYIFRRHYDEVLNYDIIERDLGMLGLSKFAEHATKLADMWFGEVENLDGSYRVFADYVINCGAYGNEENFILNNEAMGCTDSKIKYILRRSFPDLKSMKRRFPKLDKYPVLLPYYWVYRLYNHGIKRRSYVKSELQGMDNVDYSKIDEIKKLYSELGISNK